MKGNTLRNSTLIIFKEKEQFIINLLKTNRLKFVYSIFIFIQKNHIWLVLLKKSQKKVTVNIDYLSEKFVHNDIQPIREDRCVARGFMVPWEYFTTVKYFQSRGISMGGSEKLANGENKNQNSCLKVSLTFCITEFQYST